MTNKSHSDDVEFIRALAELLRENELTELQVKREYGDDGALNVRVSRAAAPAPAPTFAPPVAQPTMAESSAQSPVHDVSVDPADHPGAVASPMVGTVYLQPEPDSPAFVSVGSTVQEGQTLLIIEAMKTMNQIPSPRSGKVTRILVDDASPVEYGAPLVIIE